MVGQFFPLGHLCVGFWLREPGAGRQGGGGGLRFLVDTPADGVPVLVKPQYFCSRPGNLKTKTGGSRQQ